MKGAGITFAPNVGLFDITLTVPPGQILGMIGPSGCGKTTTVRMLNGQYRTQTGTVRVLGRDPTTFRSRDRERIGYMPQQFVLYPNLTVAENAHFVGSLYGVPRWKRGPRVKELLDFVDLTDARHRLASKLSGGMQRRLLLASMLLHDPQVIFADEPTAGIDPILRTRFWEQFRHLRDEGRTLLITTQIISEAAYCDVVALMSQGRILHIETPDRLRQIAQGGDALLISVDVADVPRALALLRQLPKVSDARPARGEPGTMMVRVAEADRALPLAVTALQEAQPPIAANTVEEYKISFDEAFTVLVQRAEREAQQ